MKLLSSFGFTGALAGLSIAVALMVSALGADAQAPTGGPDFIDTSAPFSHDTHLGQKAAEKNDGKKLDCSSCHEVVNPDGQCPKQEVRFPKHEACAKCHQANFYTPPLTICVNCHTSMEFKKGNPLKDLGRQVTPRKAEFNHKLHLIAKGKARKMTGKKLDCTSCHKIKAKGKVVQHPSHASCCECHTNPKLEVTMNKCSSCHNASKAAGRPVSKIHSFTHAKHHRQGKDGTSMACRQCHVNGHVATRLREIKIPPMAVCVECHDGEHSWHFSSCLRCHKEGTMAGPLPESHPPTDAPEGAKK